MRFAGTGYQIDYGLQVDPCVELQGRRRQIMAARGLLRAWTSSKRRNPC